MNFFRYNVVWVIELKFYVIAIFKIYNINIEVNNNSNYCIMSEQRKFLTKFYLKRCF